MSRYTKIFLNLVLIIYFSLFFIQKINLTTADLGRHFKNGELFFKEHKIYSTNYYSYTQPDFSIINHHWLSGVVFYLIHSQAGFSGLSIVYALLNGITIYIVFRMSVKKSNLAIGLLVTLFLMPLLSARKEIRPEVFTFLFSSLYLYFLDMYKNKAISYKKLVVILLSCQVLWVNTHILFILGFVILGAAAVENLLISRKGKPDVRLLWLLVLSLLVSIINPFTIRGLLEPLSIFKEYGYMLVENQSVFFVQRRFPSLEYFHFELILIIVGLAVTYLITKKELLNNLLFLIPAGVLLITGTLAIRGIPIAVLFLIPLFSIVLRDIALSNLYPIAFLILTLVPNLHFSIYKHDFGVGLKESMENSAYFFKQNNISGPIFNNYDIGGYLIYELFPKEKVFVDNRPEAYSTAFLKEIYIKMQEDESVWLQQSKEYGFNAIYFYRHDATPWAQPFLIKRLDDVNWIPVYVDDYVLILVRNAEKNMELIKKYALPKELFVTTS